MSKGSPRTSLTAAEARKAVLDALTAGQPLPEVQAREMVDTLTERYRSPGWSDGYDEGLTDGEDRY